MDGHARTGRTFKGLAARPGIGRARRVREWIGLESRFGNCKGSNGTAYTASACTDL